MLMNAGSRLLHRPQDNRQDTGRQPLRLNREFTGLDMAGWLTKYAQRCGRAVKRFGSAERGATAVEFALIAPVFLATLIAILQVAVFLFAQQALQNAAVQAGRLFMTGQAQNYTQTQLTNSICPGLQPIFNCNYLMVNVQNYSNFANADASTPTLTFNQGGQVTNAWSYSPGSPGQVMVVQLIYQWSVVGGPLGFALSNLPNNKAEMVGVTAFRVEPY